jgi:hypothetical protein
MSRQTHFPVQAFDAEKGHQLKACAPIVCRSEEGARWTAERLALSKTGVVAFSMNGMSRRATTTTSQQCSFGQVGFLMNLI